MEKQLNKLSFLNTELESDLVTKFSSVETQSKEINFLTSSKMKLENTLDEINILHEREIE